MAQAQETSKFDPSSPHSTSEIPDSFKGTPDTRLTTFSPENGETKADNGVRNLAPGAPITASVTGPPVSKDLGNDNKDPFVADHSDMRASQKLSPMASSFQPFPFQMQTNVSLVEHGSVGQNKNEKSLSAALSKDLGLSRYLAATATNKISITDIETSLAVSFDMSQTDVVWITDGEIGSRAWHDPSFRQVP